MCESSVAVLLDFDWKASYVLATDRLSTAPIRNLTVNTVAIQTAAEDEKEGRGGWGIPLLQLLVDVARVAPVGKAAGLCPQVPTLASANVQLLATDSTKLPSVDVERPSTYTLLPNDRLLLELNGDDLDALIASLHTAVDRMPS
ncbi:hypothetical protein DQ04_02411000 [Trypanosoma grayi]|uniref:hypothetical protein n=1 Tax=Trypanosoma grayi TaxID=71804 RepID=UPI0004F4B8F1|nr:hypothetical protein DQ04_02411000 [Trypanosoma grayi]KEG11635.1 hypothetical protein DQ04_02411000 [Trypanosoma grayi]